MCIDALPVDLNDFVSLPGDTFMTKYGNVWVTLPSLFSPAAVVPPPTTVVTVPIEYHYTNAFGCTSINDSVMTVHPLPLLSFTVHDTCAHTPLVIVNTSTINSGTVQNWLWNITGQQPLTSQQVGPFSYGADTIGIQLTATSDRGCSTTLADTALVHPVPAAGFLVEDDCQFDTIPYTNLSTIDWAEPLWDWRFEDGKEFHGTEPQPCLADLGQLHRHAHRFVLIRLRGYHDPSHHGTPRTHSRNCFHGHLLRYPLCDQQHIHHTPRHHRPAHLGPGGRRATGWNDRPAPVFDRWPLADRTHRRVGPRVYSDRTRPHRDISPAASRLACIRYRNLRTRMRAVHRRIYGHRTYQNVDWQWTVSNGHVDRTGHHRVFPGKW
ncbi:MAG: hypothetical protein IPI07_17085 [Flavobacteriales bacterium]|nr:hypothetical protein [Flavobacteriales bacterium]